MRRSVINTDQDPSPPKARSGSDNDYGIWDKWRSVANLRADNPRNIFYTKFPDGTVQPWIVREPSDPPAKLEADEARKQYASNYWIATVPPEIIKDHLDIWSDPAMEMLAGIYRIVEQLSLLPPPERRTHAMQAD